MITADSPQLVAPPGLKGMVVADTRIGAVRGSEGFYHYREYDATTVARTRSFEAVVHLLLEGALPTVSQESDLRRRLARARALPERLAELVDRLSGSDPLVVLRSVLSVELAGHPTLDMSPEQQKDALLRAVGLTPTVLARAHRRGRGLPPLDPDRALSHCRDYVRMVTGSAPSEAASRAVETYMCLTADHGFNASTFTARVITSTGADIGGILCGALTALSGPLHGGAPSRVLDMLDAIGDPSRAREWAAGRLEGGEKIMGFGHAVYRAADPRSELLREAARSMGGPLASRALAIEPEILDALAAWKPHATIVTNVEYYAAVVMGTVGIPQEMFTPTFASSRMAGWAAHVLEQATDNKIMRPSARYVGPAAPVPLPPVAQE